MTVRQPDDGHRRGSSEAVFLAVALVGLALYLLLFFWTPLPSLAQFAVAGESVDRGTFVLQLLGGLDEIVLSWFGDPPELSLLDRLPVALLAAMILGLATAAGWLLLGWLRTDDVLSGLESLVFSAAVGVNTVSLYVLLVGLMGQLRNLWLFAVPAAAAAAFGGRRLASVLRTPRAARWPASVGCDIRDESWLGRRWRWAAVVFVAITVLGGLLPPLEFDVREYHLQVPKEFFQRGRIAFLPHNVYGNMPLGPQMLSLVAMVFAGDWWTGALAGKTVTSLFLPLTGLALFAAGHRFFSRSAGVAAALVYVSTPWLVQVSNLGLVEGVYGFYLFLSVYAIILWRHAGGRGSGGSRAGAVAPAGARTGQPPAPPGRPGMSSLLLLAGFLAGGAASCKYSAVVFVVAPLAAWVFLARRRPDWRSVGIYLLAVFVGCGPWFVKNLVLAGNPVYPLAYAVFGGATWTAEKDQKWHAAHDPEGFSPGDAARRTIGVLLRSEWLSPLIMPLAALSLLAGRQRRLVMWLWIYFGYVIASWWLLTHRIDRFWIPSLPVVALLSGLGATWTAAALWRRVLVPMLILAIAVSFLFAVGGPGGYNRYFVSYARLRVSAERVDPWHLFLNEHVPPGYAVLAVGDAQVFDLATPVIYSTVFDDCALERALKGHSPAELHAWLVGNRISHVYVHWGEIARYRAPGNYGFTTFIQPAVLQMLVERGVLAPPEPPIEGHPGRLYMVLGLPASSTAPWTTTSSPRAGGTISYELASGGKT